MPEYENEYWDWDYRDVCRIAEELFIANVGESQHTPAQTAKICFDAAEAFSAELLARVKDKS